MGVAATVHDTVTIAVTASDAGAPLVRDIPVALRVLRCGGAVFFSDVCLGSGQARQRHDGRSRRKKEFG